MGRAALGRLGFVVRVVVADRRPRVLVIASVYVPSRLSAGPIRSIEAIVEALADELSFYVLCADRDPGDALSYEGIRPRSWTQVGKAQVWYEPKGRMGPRLYRKLLKDLEPTTIYFNNLYSFREFLLPAVIALASRRRVRLVGGPRGIFDPGALSLKRTKKLAYIRALRLSGLPARMIFQASNEREAEQIRKALGPVEVVTTGHLVLPPAPPSGVEPTRPRKVPGRLDIVILGRVHPTKNLEYLLARVARVRGEITLTIAGEAEDPAYRSRCMRAAEKLEHVTIVELGAVPHDQVFALLGRHDIMALPTLGENFCHAIAESLSARTPVLVSDRTPWRGLAECGGGWDIPLEAPLEWEARLQQVCDMSAEELAALRNSTTTALSDLIDADRHRTAHLQLLTGASR